MGPLRDHLLGIAQRYIVFEKARSVTDLSAPLMPIVDDKKDGLAPVPIRWKRPLPRHAALVAGIHVFPAVLREKDVDGRDKPGHDAK